MSDLELCPYISDAPGHFACLLEPGHDGEHEGLDLGCSPDICDHQTAAPGERYMNADEVAAFKRRLESMSLEELVALREDPEARQALAQEVAPDPEFEAKVSRLADLIYEYERRPSPAAQWAFGIGLAMVIALIIAFIQS
jgi:hypothetical protein